MRIVYLLSSLGVGGAEKQALAVGGAHGRRAVIRRIARAHAASSGRVAHRRCLSFTSMCAKLL